MANFAYVSTQCGYRTVCISTIARMYFTVHSHSAKRTRAGYAHFVQLGGDLLSGQRAGAVGMPGKVSGPPIANKDPEFAARTTVQPRGRCSGRKTGAFDRAADKTP